MAPNHDGKTPGRGIGPIKIWEDPSCREPLVGPAQLLLDGEGGPQLHVDRKKKLPEEWGPRPPQEGVEQEQRGEMPHGTPELTRLGPEPAGPG